jgi:hypothetical protein
MRYVDPTEVELELPENWNEQVQVARAYVQQKVQEAEEIAIQEDKSPEEKQSCILKARKKAINAKSNVWVNAGKAIRKVMAEKCWYCEARETRSDMPVDHFRPKNCVAECKEHEGYWWLAFNWGNYRYSCTYCNSRRVDVESEGGKQDHFPLLNPGDRVFDENGDIKAEHPVLVDPCDVDDVKLLIYLPNGQPREADQDDKSEAFFRANQSIYYYHLNHHKAVRRRKQIAISIRQHVIEIDILIAANKEGQNDNGQIKYHKKEIIKQIRSKAPFCTASRLYFQQYRKREWVQDILCRDI